MKIREMKFSDYKQISKIAIQNNLKIYKYDDWKSLWSKNPFYIKKNRNWSKGWVIEIDNKIIGFLGNFPMLYYIFGKKYVTAVSTCWIVKKRFRKYSALLINEYFKQKNIDIFLTTTASITTGLFYKAYGGQNILSTEYKEDLLFIFKLDKVLLAFLNKINFSKKKIYILKYIFFFLRPITFIPSLLINLYYFILTKRIKKKFLIYNSFNKEFNLLWDDLKKKNKTFNLIRNKEWLNYHFEHYRKSNKIFIIVNKTRGKILSYCILIEKINIKLNIKKLCLVDFLSLKQNNDCIDLIKYCIKFANLNNYDYLEIIGFNANKRKIIKNFHPFVRRFKQSRFCYVAKNQFLKKKLINTKNLDFSMIDGDSII